MSTPTVQQAGSSGGEALYCRWTSHVSWASAIPRIGAQVSIPQRILGLLVVFAAVLAVQLGLQLYQWSTTGEERAEVAALREEAVDEGARLIAMRARADTLAVRVRDADETLNSLRRNIDRFERWSQQGRLSASLFPAYRDEVESYRSLAYERNALLRELERASVEHRSAVVKYNELTARIRVLATEAGDPYFRVPTPAEAAVERGVLTPP